jgi:hypothetical protein
MERKEVLERLGTEGKIFTVKFIKRSDGSLRTMRARLGVKSALKGGEQAYDPKKYNLITVYDMDKKDYRSINCDQVVEIAANGEVEKFKTTAKKSPKRKTVKKKAAKKILKPKADADAVLKHQFKAKLKKVRV